MNRPSQTQDALIRSVVERYQRDGYDVVVEPDPSDVPFDLGGYRPDLILRKGNLTYIVEVKNGADSTSFDNLRSIVGEIKRHVGWRFLLITRQDVLGLDAPIEDGIQVSWEEIENDMQHSARLSDFGENDLAYLILWITFERMMRYQASLIGLPMERLAPSFLIRQLYSQGELTMAQFDTALECQELRNRVVHGFPTSGVKNHLERLRTLIADLQSQWVGNQGKANMQTDET